jgi:hypothetical protein
MGAKRDAVYRIAENFDVPLINEEVATRAMLTVDNRESLIIQYLKDALEVEAARHKQYFLCKLASALGLKEILEDVEDRGKAP